MAKTGKKKAIAAAAAVLVLLAAALAAWLSLSVRVGDRRYRRADVIDARAAALSCAEYDAAAQENPSARIRWSVPLGGERFDSFSEELVLSALPESEIERLGYFPSLRHVDAEGCTDYPALAAAAAKFGGAWRVSVEEYQEQAQSGPSKLDRLMSRFDIKYDDEGD